ncbi:MAG: hypothetical protein ABII89_01340 [Candidatus Omnitrophota bacterium]
MTILPLRVLELSVFVVISSHLLDFPGQKLPTLAAPIVNRRNLLFRQDLLLFYFTISIEIFNTLTGNRNAKNIAAYRYQVADAAINQFPLVILVNRLYRRL